MIRVAIVDDWEESQTGLRGMLETSAAIEIVGAAYTAAEGRRLIETKQPDIALIDIELGLDENGMALVEELEQLCPAVRKIIVTAHVNEYGVERLLKAGAMGYLTKNMRTAELIKCVETVSSGGTHISRDAMEKLSKEWRAGRNAQERPSFTTREQQILPMIVHGYTNKQMARELVVSKRAPEKHVAAILDKLAANNRAEAVFKLIKLGLVSLDDL